MESPIRQFSNLNRYPRSINRVSRFCSLVIRSGCDPAALWASAGVQKTGNNGRRVSEFLGVNFRRSRGRGPYQAVGGPCTGVSVKPTPLPPHSSAYCPITSGVETSQLVKELVKAANPLSNSACSRCAMPRVVKIAPRSVARPAPLLADADLRRMVHAVDRLACGTCGGASPFLCL
jgi:hypothetical protein